MPGTLLCLELGATDTRLSRLRIDCANSGFTLIFLRVSCRATAAS